MMVFVVVVVSFVLYKYQSIRKLNDVASNKT
jgi:hypothetical protein